MQETFHSGHFTSQCPSPKVFTKTVYRSETGVRVRRTRKHVKPEYRGNKFQQKSVAGELLLHTGMIAERKQEMRTFRRTAA